MATIDAIRKKITEDQFELDPSSWIDFKVRRAVLPPDTVEHLQRTIWGKRKPVRVIETPVFELERLIHCARTRQHGWRPFPPRRIILPDSPNRESPHRRIAMNLRHLLIRRCGDRMFGAHAQIKVGELNS